MFVAHDPVEAHLVGPGVLIMVFVVEYVGLIRVKMGIGEAKTPRIVLIEQLVVDISIGLL